MLALLVLAAQLAMPKGHFIVLDRPVVTASEPQQRIRQRIQHAERQQANIATWLTQRKVQHKRYWLGNRIYLPQADSKLIEQLRQAGYRVEPEQIIQLEPMQPEPANAAGTQPGVQFVKAPDLWSLGLEGQDVLVATIDTGIYTNHPDLKDAWTGIFRDPANICGSAGPCDNNGHGTHVAGTILGRNGIGVAPKAKLMACKGCESAWCSQSSLLDCAQWIIDKRPAVVNNSWGGGQSDWFRDAVDAWLDAGIFPVVAAGNAGPYCGTVGSPGNYATSFTVGAVDASNGRIAQFSSRGPGDTVKPDVTAPGVAVLSAWPDGGYARLSGTSMATPHVSGIVALLKPLGFPNDRIAEALRQSAQPVNDRTCGGNNRANNTYGYGYADALAAYNYLKQGPPPPPPADQPPAITILQPANGQQFNCGDIIVAKGQAVDKEDGDLSAQIVWWSNYPFWKGPTAELIGPTGKGCEMGWHLVKATVADSAGNQAEAQVWVYVVKP